MSYPSMATKSGASSEPEHMAGEGYLIPWAVPAPAGMPSRGVPPPAGLLGGASRSRHHVVHLGRQRVDPGEPDDNFRRTRRAAAHALRAGLSAHDRAASRPGA